MRTRRWIAGIIILISMVYLIGCDEDSDNSGIVNIPERPSNYFMAIAGLSTMSFLDIHKEYVVPDKIPLGLGANWVGEDFETFFVVNSISNNLQIFRKSDHIENVYLYQTVDLGIQENNNPYSACIQFESPMMASKLYVTNLMQNSVSVVHIGGDSRIDTTWQVGQAPEGILYINNHIFVVNSGYDFSAGLNGHRNGSVYKLNTLTGEIVDSIQVGMNPQYIEISRDGKLHISCTGNYGDVTGEIYIIDQDLNISNIIPVDAYPGKIYFNDIYCYAACGGWESEGDSHGLVLAYEFQNPEDIHYINVDLGAMDISDGFVYPSTAYVVCFDAMTVCSIKDYEMLNSYELDEPPVAVSKLQLY